MAVAAAAAWGAALLDAKVDEVLGTLALGTALAPLCGLTDAMAFGVVSQRYYPRMRVRNAHGAHPEDLLDDRCVLGRPHRLGGAAAAVLIATMQHRDMRPICLRRLDVHPDDARLRQFAERFVRDAFQILRSQASCK